jgi:hypothetical protein
MTWTSGYCDCGNTVDYGMYNSEHEDEHSEITVKVVCGECVRERDGIPSEEEKSEGFKIFQNEVEKHGLMGAIDRRGVLSKYPALSECIEIACELYENSKHEDERLTYIRSIWSLCAM